ncbi:MAG TPA: hypothetical protein PK926_03380 [Spirochaetota bacterium]|nr:hypothetical protein [Spirochaetota bacterium]HPI88780.1 hypothetical protein [Spirochaetota bacterium]HPR47146.1 hypothetical protein [Spirochaetota bacterium]
MKFNAIPFNVFRNKKLIRAVSIVVLFSFTTLSCVTNYQYIKSIPKKSRMAVLVANKSGLIKDGSLKYSYIYDAIRKANYVPVAMNEVQIDVKINCGNPIVFDDFKKYLVETKVDYLMVVYVWSSGLDEDLKISIVSVSDMEIVANRYYKRRLMTGLWAGLTPLLGLGLLICPWLYLKDADNSNYDKIVQFINQL